jgi:hypothetical protein
MQLPVTKEQSEEFRGMGALAPPHIHNWIVDSCYLHGGQLSISGALGMVCLGALEVAPVSGSLDQNAALTQPSASTRGGNE